ncbi:amidohydrolase family protein [Microbacterium sp. 22215]|uniref:amidohydrolase family protein n=1 Tax=Microbacterium sp. 22215 TaxID=3453893 RepID=UPI003F869DC2
MHAATFFDGEGWRDGIVELRDGQMLLREESPAHDLPRLDGVIVGGFTDHHVHLQLVDHALLHGSTLGRVVDLGANPAVIATIAARALPAAPIHGDQNAPDLPGGVRNAPESRVHGAFSTPQSERGEVSGAFSTPQSERGEVSGAFSTPHAVTVEFAGAFLTPVGGYPSDRSWAPAGSVREIADAASASTAVAEMADAGASSIKVASNSAAGPVFSDDLFRAIVAAAAERGLPVVAHAEGPGEAQRTPRLGAAFLAHAPFTERLDDADIAAQAVSVSWISTLSVHDGDAQKTAVDNVRRFHAAGGTVLYGTDMGNGPTPVGVSTAELTALRAAGVTGTDLLRALAPQDPLDPASLLLLLPDTGTPADTGHDTAPSLARPLTSADLKA